jgi:hypothetical protein
MKQQPIAALSPALERMLLVAMMRGEVPVDVVEKAELGREAQWLHLAIKKLGSKKDKKLTLQAVATMAEEEGAEPEVIRPFLKKMAGLEPEGAREILRAVRQRQALVTLMNEASRQLGESKLDPAALQNAIRIETEDDEDPTLFAEDVEDAPEGPDLGPLKKISKASGGLMGFWVIAGDPGAGKSTLALQIAAIAAGKHKWPVAYCDAENSKRVMRYRLQRQLPKDKYPKAAKRIRYVDMRGFTTEIPAFIQAHKPPALIVIDPLQKLPTRVDHKRESLESWLRRFEDWAKDGYMVLALSEKDRATYGTATSKLGKETGEVEYSAWFGFHMVGGKTEDDPVSIVVKKNRHRSEKGHVVDLVRDEKRPLWFNEQRWTRGDEEDE